MSVQFTAHDLKQAARWGDTRKIERCLDSGQVDIEFIDQDFKTALSWAAFHGCKDATDLLIRRKAKLDHVDFSGNTALHWAAANDCHAVCLLLLKAKANSNLKNKEDKTAVQLATENLHKPLSLFMKNFIAT